MTLSLDERVKLIEHYFACNCCPKATLDAYRRAAETKKTTGPCSKRSLERLVKKFRATGNVLDQTHSGRPKLDESISTRVEQAFKEISRSTRYGESSIRQVSKSAGVPRSSVLRIASNILQLHPYKLRRLHELMPDDFTSRLAFANRCCTEIETDPDWLRRILWNDEANFPLYGEVNAHNCCIWPNDPPHKFVQRRMLDEHITVWCGFTSQFIIGPYFFQEPSRRGFKSVTVTAERYETMLRDYVIPALADRGVLSSVIFQQDGAPPHISIQVKRLLKDTFINRVISRDFDFPWPPRSPDLTPCDYWLWGYLKSRVYLRNPANIAELKESIITEVSDIKPDQLCSAVSAFGTRIEAVLGANGGHFEHLK